VGKDSHSDSDYRGYHHFDSTVHWFGIRRNIGGDMSGRSIGMIFDVQLVGFVS